MDTLSDEHIKWLRSLHQDAQQAETRLKIAVEGVIRGAGLDPSEHEINLQTGAIMPTQENGQPKMETE